MFKILFQLAEKRRIGNRKSNAESPWTESREEASSICQAIRIHQRTHRPHFRKQFRWHPRPLNGRAFLPDRDSFERVDQLKGARCGFHPYKSAWKRNKERVIPIGKELFE